MTVYNIKFTLPKVRLTYHAHRGWCRHRGWDCEIIANLVSHQSHHLLSDHNLPAVGERTREYFTCSRTMQVYALIRTITPIVHDTEHQFVVW